MGETGTEDDAGESVSGGIRDARGDGADEEDDEDDADDAAVEAVAAAADSDDQCAENGEASRFA